MATWKTSCRSEAVGGLAESAAAGVSTLSPLRSRAGGDEGHEVRWRRARVIGCEARQDTEGHAHICTCAGGGVDVSLTQWTCASNTKTMKLNSTPSAC